jgi:DNA polymerase III epsilon subunit-like protein
MKYVSVDIETTGLNPDYCQILEIGAVIDDLSDQRPLEKLSKFHCYVTHDMIVGDPFALSMHPVILRRIADKEVGFDYYEPALAVERFNAWLSNYPDYPKDLVNFAGKNFAAFDLQFLKCLPDWDNIIKYRHRIIDPAMLFWRAGDKSLPGSKECLKRAGIGGEVAHTALEDAMDVVKVVRAGWKAVVKG